MQKNIFITTFILLLTTKKAYCGELINDYLNPDYPIHQPHQFNLTNDDYQSQNYRNFIEECNNNLVQSLANLQEKLADVRRENVDQSKELVSSRQDNLNQSLEILKEKLHQQLTIYAILTEQEQIEQEQIGNFHEEIIKKSNPFDKFVEETEYMIECGFTCSNTISEKNLTPQQKESLKTCLQDIHRVFSDASTQYNKKYGVLENLRAIAAQPETQKIFKKFKNYEKAFLALNRATSKS